MYMFSCSSGNHPLCLLPLASLAPSPRINHRLARSAAPNTHTVYVPLLSTHPFRHPVANAPQEELGHHRELEGVNHHDLCE